MKQYTLLLFGALCLSFGCKSSKPAAENVADDAEITFKFIQLNDVYEIAPLNGGRHGGMERVAHIRDSIAAGNPNTYLFMAGDFLNPSLLGTLSLDSEHIAGRQMVEVMNAMHFDLVTFGNHEFDLEEGVLQKRLNESDFAWTSANVYNVKGNAKVPFMKTRGGSDIPLKRKVIMNMKDADGTEIKVGFFGITIDSNPKDFVFYGDIYSEAEAAYKSLQDSVDLVIGLTHLNVSQDKKLAALLPEIPLIMGGHEHFSMLVRERNARITKADANARTIYIHTLTYNVVTGSLEIDSYLMPVNETIPSKPEVAAIVVRWNEILEKEIKKVIEQPNEIIYLANPPLDGTDGASRAIQTNLGAHITAAMTFAYNNALDAALVNGGSIRIDDIIEGEVTAMDVFRVLPFGGSVLKVRLKGGLLKEVLDYGKAKQGTGAYLQRHNISEAASGEWLVNGTAIAPEGIYTVAFSDFLMKGYDIPFLTPENEGILEIYHPNKTETAFDIRKAVILYFKSLGN